MEATFSTHGSRYTWTVRITVGLLKRIKEHNQIALIDANYNSQDLAGLVIDLEKLGDVLWTCVRRQAEEKGVSRDDFIDELGATELSEGWDALKEGVVFFIQSQSQKAGDAVRRAIDKQVLMQGKMCEAWAEEMMSAEIDETLKHGIDQAREQLHKTLRSSLTN